MLLTSTYTFLLFSVQKEEAKVSHGDESMIVALGEEITKITKITSSYLAASGNV